VTGNIFDDLLTLVKPKDSQPSHELDMYLSTGVKNISDALAWWHEHRAMYPWLSRMAMDYLTIPGACPDMLSFMLTSFFW